MLDTNVVSAALRSTEGASAEVIRGVRQGRGTFLLSTPPLLEYEAKCKEPEHLKAFDLTKEEVDVVLGVLVACAEPVATTCRWRPQLRDATDEMVLEAAVNGRADAVPEARRGGVAGLAPLAQSRRRKTKVPSSAALSLTETP